MQCFRNHEYQARSSITANEWLTQVGRRIGHQVYELLDMDDQALASHGLLHSRIARKDLIQQDNARLSGLGVRFCANIETYHSETGIPEP
jgi:hypothetical protein